jgi:plasmid stabilization system protein ParE
MDLTDTIEKMTGDDKKYKLSNEAAKAVVQKIFDYYEIDKDDIKDKKARDIIAINYDHLVKSARRGRLEVDLTNGIIVKQHLRSNPNEVITYKEIDGTAKKAMAGKEETDFYGRIYAIQGSLSDLGEGGIAKLKGVDLGLCEVLGAIFLQA